MENMLRLMYEEPNLALDLELTGGIPMDTVLTKGTISISEFKKNPNEVVKLAKNVPFAVMTNNKPSFYVLSPKHYDALLEKIWELEITPKILERTSEIDDAVPVSLDELKRGLSN